MFNAAKWSNSPSHWEKYKCIRNNLKVVAMLRRNKKQYFYNLRFSSQKEFWKAIKLINKQDTTIPALQDSTTPINSNDV
jgi:hypothetical protein